MNRELTSSLVAPLALFVAFYLATMLAGVLIGVPWTQWVALASVVIATTATIVLWEGGAWPLGLRERPLRATAHALGGVVLAVVLIGSADLLIMFTTQLRHGRGSALSLRELTTVFLPAVFHEELLFRGYGFQKLWRWYRSVAIIGVSVAFAGLHLWNNHVTPLALVNVFLGGVLLSFAYERYRTLWFPIGLHAGWNLLSGPILGYSVSGWTPDGSVFTVAGSGPTILTGGGFGMEGSIWMTVVELAAIGLLWRTNAKVRTRKAE